MFRFKHKKLQSYEIRGPNKSYHTHYIKPLIP